MKKYTLVAIVFTLMLAAVARADESLAVVVGAKSGVDALSQAELVKVFKGTKTKGPDGVKFVIVMREPGSLEREGALKFIYAMTDQEYQKYFLQATFTGAVTSAPKQLSGAAAVKQFVASNPGAIGYLKASDLDESVKAVKIDGKAPGDADYKLKLK